MAEKNDATGAGGMEDDVDESEAASAGTPGPRRSSRLAVTAPPSFGPHEPATATTTGRTAPQRMDLLTPVSNGLFLFSGQRREATAPSATPFNFGSPLLPAPRLGSGSALTSPAGTFGAFGGGESAFLGQQYLLPVLAPFTGGPFTNGAQIQTSTFASASGTPTPFNPLRGNDFQMENGLATPVSTRFQSISCMKEYENKSLEELRYEDYQLNRKGPRGNEQCALTFSVPNPAGNIFPSNPTPSPGFVFGAAAAPSSTPVRETPLFEHSPALGSSTPTFGGFGGGSTLSSLFGPSPYSGGDGAGGGLFAGRGSSLTPGSSSGNTSLFGSSTLGGASPALGFGGSTLSSRIGPNSFAGGDGGGANQTLSFGLLPFGATSPPQQGLGFQALRTTGTTFCGFGTHSQMLFGLDPGRQYLLMELEHPTSPFGQQPPPSTGKLTKTWRFESGDK